MSGAREIVSAICKRLEQIDTGNQYRTKAGQKVWRGREQFFEDETFPCCSVFIDAENAEQETTSLTRRALSVSVVALDKADINDPLDTEMNLLEDLKRALMPESRRRHGRDTLDGFALWVDFAGAQVNPRQAAGKLCEIRLDLVVHYQEALACAA